MVRSQKDKWRNKMSHTNTVLQMPHGARWLQRNRAEGAELGVDRPPFHSVKPPLHSDKPPIHSKRMRAPNMRCLQATRNNRKRASRANVLEPIRAVTA